MNKKILKKLTLRESFDRLHFTIRKQNIPNQTDADAFLIICENYKIQEKKAIQENILFAKLYALILSEFLKYYTDIDFANEQINKILSQPLNLRLQILQDSLKTNELYCYFRQKKILDKFLFTKNFNELIEVNLRYKDKLPQLNENDFFSASSRWEFEEVVYNFETSVNCSIQNYKTNV